MIIKRYKLFVEQIDSDNKDTLSIKAAKDRLNMFIKDVSEYNSKKQSLEDLIVNSEQGVDISSKVDSIVGDNSLLSKYVTISNMAKRIKTMENNVDYNSNVISERENDLRMVGKLSDKEDRESQTIRLKEDISDRKSKIGDTKKNIVEAKKDYNDKVKELDEYIKISKEKIDNDIKELEKQ